MARPLEVHPEKKLAQRRRLWQFARVRTRVPMRPRTESWTLPEGSFFEFLATRLPEIATEAVVGGIFDPTLGRGSIAPEHLVAILLLRYFENVSYEVAAQWAQYDVRWKAVLGEGRRSQARR